MNIKLTTVKSIAIIFFLLYFSFVGYNIGKYIAIKQQGVEITDI